MKVKKRQTKSKENGIQKIFLPHYISDYSCNYNYFILPIYLYLKQRINKQYEIYFSYKAMLQYFQTDKFTKVYEKDIISALLFLLLGININEICITNSFEISNYNLNNILKNILSLLQLSIDENNKIVIQTKSDKYNSDDLIELFIKELQKNHNLLLIDITENVEGYLLIDWPILNLLEWYCLQHQKYNEELSKLIISDTKGLEKIQKKYNIQIFNRGTKISYVTLINIYIYIYRLYDLNKFLQHETFTSYANLKDKFSISSNTIKNYIDILLLLQLLTIVNGSFKTKKSTSYNIIEDWTEIAIEDYSQLIPYKLSLITKEQYNEIKSCYKKQNEPIIDPTVKRKRGRPRKNPIN